ncbi:hypothetical protein PM10SUCC1_22090 [Propionigenium maris DSM 9537]|uniref:Uncharacterized protein n=1 Tax=Propionigenium maris DSM 9537 TaxID=1123000 RepID=A0A9W6GM64_9FUSO|nr:hypothetical protein PM10SUCC1_22090 [Propionigenium maris DSM 9537]
MLTVRRNSVEGLALEGSPFSMAKESLKKRDFSTEILYSLFEGISSTIKYSDIRDFVLSGNG